VFFFIGFCKKVTCVSQTYEFILTLTNFKKRKYLWKQLIFNN